MSRMIKCKVCNEDMAANAKTCPKCGAKNKKPIYKKWWVWAIVAVVIIGAFAGGGEEPVKTGEKKTEAQYAVKDIINTEKFEIVVTDVKTSKKVGGAYFNTEPSEGGIFVVLEWEYKNISDSPVAAFSCPSARLVDKNGTKYDADLDATASYATEIKLDRKVLSDLNPGIKVKDAQVFEISEEAYNAGGFSVKIVADKEIEVKIN
ncbi:MAG: DUF4352 domain-containing protein [Clostridia bacterium]|nr:DUF4352 domain-containing protein [Clostridia bacterium]